jgi:hypothetical protein
MKPTWWERTSTLLYQGEPSIALVTLEINKTFVFHPFLETTPTQGLFKMHLTVIGISEVILLGLKSKVAIFSIHKKKFVLISCIVQAISAYDFTRVGASEKKALFEKLAQY